MTPRPQIDEFLAQRTLAVVGVSRNKNDFSRQLVRLLRRNEFTIYAVNPFARQLDGEPCYPHLSDLPTLVDGALLMVPEGMFDSAIKECADAGIPRIWLYGVGHPRRVSEETLAFCREKNITLINGWCPRMFLPGTSWPHRLHGWIATKIENRKLKTETVT